MEAVVVTAYGGSAETVQLRAPEAHAGQVLIKVLAAGMNPMDRQSTTFQVMQSIRLDLGHGSQVHP